MRLVYLYTAILSAATLLAQTDPSIDEPLLFPPGNDLVLAAQLGYRSERNWLYDVAFEANGPTDKRVPCGEPIQEIRVAGPMLLGVREGQMARTHSEAMPINEDSLHSRGTLLLEMDAFSDKESDTASVVLKVRSREYRPLAAYVKSAKSFYCWGGWDAWKIQYAYTFGFAPGQIRRNWIRGATLIVIFRGRRESYPLDLKGVLSLQERRIRRNFMPLAK